MHFNHGWHMGGIGFWWLPVVGVAIAGLFLLSFVRRTGSERASPEKMLKNRYVKGNIDRETYERMLDDLRK